MKKILSLVIAVCLSIGTVPVFASDATGTYYDDTWHLEGNTLYVKGGDANIGGYIPVRPDVPKYIMADDYSDQIEVVVFEEGIETIGDCLVGLNKVHTVHIPSTTKEMVFGNNVKYVVSENNPYYSSADGVLFNGDKTILLDYPKSKDDMVYTLPDSVIKIDASAFADNKYIKTVIFNEKLTEIGDRAFKNCDSLGSVSLPDSVKKIGEEAFTSCNSLATLNLGSVEEIGDYCFRYTAIKTLTIPKTLKKMGVCLFYDLDTLTHVTIEDGVTEISNQAFAHCSSLEEVTIPDSVTSIESNAFFGTKLQQYDDALYIGEKLLLCTADGSYSVKEGTRFIANGAFKESSVTHINLPESITSIGQGAFSGAKSLESIKLPASLAEINLGAFNNTKLKSIYLGKNVRVIMPGVFNNCKYLEEIIVDENNLYYSSIDGVLFNKEKTKLVTYPKDKKNEEYVVPETVTVNVEGSIISNNYIKKLVFPDGMTVIPDGFASGCENLEEVVLGSNVTAIGTRSFYNCKNLKNINLPETLEKIGAGAFEKTALTDIVLPEALTEIGGQAFFECRQLKNVTMGNHIKTIGSNAFTFCSALEKLYVPDSVESINDYAFQGCGMLKEVYIGSGKMGMYLFNGDTGLEKATLGDKVENVSVGMFNDCKALKEAYIGNGAENIAKQAFEDCYSLEKLTIGKNVQGIDGDLQGFTGLKEIILSPENEHLTLSDGVLFTKDMTKLILYPGKKDGESYTVPEGVKVLGNQAFSGADKLKEINLPTTIEKIDTQAFWHCRSLKDIIIPKSVKELGNITFNGSNVEHMYYMGTEDEWQSVIKPSHGGLDLRGKGIISFNYVPVQVIADGKDVDFASYVQRPYIKHDRTLVPMRAIFEALGAEVSWDDATKTAIGVKDGIEVKITIGENVLYKNGEVIELDCAAEITNDRTMVPVRAIGEAFGCTVTWNNEMKTVEVTK